MSGNVSEKALTAKQERAALKLAEDDLTDEQIAEKAGITERQLGRWKLLPAFAERIREHRARFRLKVMSEGFADRAERVRALNSVATALLTQIAEAEYQAVIGLTDDGEPIKAFDRGRMREFRGLLDDIAKEMGDRKQVTKLEGEDGEPLPVFLIAGVKPERI